jgi:hypothetical protein
MGERFTPAQHRKNLEVAEAALAEALSSQRNPQVGGSYNIQATDIGEAFRLFVAQTRAMFGATNIELGYADGTKVKVVCIEDARRKAARVLKEKV